MEQKTSIEKIQRHISECHQRIEQKQEMWRQAENEGFWQESDSLSKAINTETSFVSGLERALAYLMEDGADEQVEQKTVAHVYVVIDFHEVTVLREIRSGLRFSRSKFPDLPVNRLIAAEFIDTGHESDGEEYITITPAGRDYLSSLEADED